MNRAQDKRVLPLATLFSKMLLACCAATCVRAQTPQPTIENRPDAARRVVRVFDFEESETNPTLVPQYWIRAQDRMAVDADGPADASSPEPRKREGFPSWNLAELDYSAPAASGTGSVRLPTRGGSTSLMLETGVLPVFQNADYSISAKVRTQGLKVARARLVARFLDGQRRQIPGSEVASPLLSGADWKQAAVELVGIYETAAFIELELQLLQPAQQGLDPRAYEALEQDLAGAAWFDSITVAQLPRIELTTNGAGNVIAAPDRPELRIDVRDLTGEALRAQVTVVDYDGAVADRLARQIGSGRAKEPWRPRLTKYGWYRAVLGVYNDQGLVGRASADFIWLPEAVTAAISRADSITQRRAFGLVVREERDSLATDLPEITRRVGAGSIMYPVWNESLTRQRVPDALKRSTIALDPLLDAGQDVILTLARVPNELADEIRADADDPWRVFAQNPAAAAPYIEPYLEKYGQRVRRWQAGFPGDDRAFWRRGLGKEIDSLELALGKLVPGPVIAVPWSIERALAPTIFPPRARHTFVSAVVPHDSGPQAIDNFAKVWREQFKGGEAPELGLVFEPIPLERYGYHTPGSELVKRVAEFWSLFGPPGAGDTAGRAASGRAASAWLLDPWNWSDERRSKLLPRPELAVWSNLVRQLADRRMVGTFQVTPGVRAYILAPTPDAPADRTGAIIAWNESAPTDLAVLRGQLAPNGGARVVDIFGNVSPAPTDSSGRASEDDRSYPPLAVPLTDTPVFIDGLDAPLARFVASVRIDPALLLATNTNHDHALVFDNPWNTAIDVKSVLVQPGGVEAESGAKDRRWRISPRSGRATVAPGKSGRIPMSVSFSPAEEGGPKPFVFDIQLIADHSYGTIRVTTPVELGLDEIKLELTSLPANAGDAVVEAQITNTGKTAATLELTAFAPGLPKVKSQVSDLPPGAQATRRFPYGGALESLRGKRVFVALTDPASGARLNRSVLIQ